MTLLPRITWNLYGNAWNLYGGDEELTGRYEVFEDLQRLDEFIARAAAAGQDIAALRTARDDFANSLDWRP